MDKVSSGLKDLEVVLAKKKKKQNNLKDLFVDNDRKHKHRTEICT